MKILVAHKYFFRGGGTATYLFNLMALLQQKGNIVIPLGVKYARCEPSLDTRYFIPPPSGAQQAFFAELPRRPLPMLKVALRACWSLVAYQQTSKAIKEQKIDVAYINNIYNYMSPSVIDACYHHGVPVIMRVADHNLVCAAFSCQRAEKLCTECVTAGLWPALRYRCVKGSRAATAVRVFSMWLHELMGQYRRVNLFITPSQWMRSLMIEKGFPPEKVVHLPSFYKANGRAAKETKEQDYLLYFGRISREKGLDVLLQAYNELRPPERLILAGDDRDGERARLEKLVEQMAIPRVSFVGQQNPEELGELIAGAKFTVIPSRVPDNCPMCVLESFAFGKPVIGSRIGGIPEQLEGDCGLLFESGNVADLTAKMKTLLTSSDYRREMGERGRRRLIEVYNEETHSERLLGLMNQIAATPVGVRDGAS
jgi:glycosyltransferase involved in cell wall biosynthesis